MNEDEGSFYNAYKKGDQRVFKCLCKHCDEFTLWTLDTMVKDGKKFAQQCELCGELTYDDEDRMDATLAGQWCSTAKRVSPDVTSYKINGFVAHASWLSWSKIYQAHQDFLAGRKSLKSFYNTILGEPFDEGGARTPSDDRARRVMTSIRYRSNEVPDDVLFLTMAVDVQKDYLDCEIKGWAKDLVSYSIRREKVPVNIENAGEATNKIREIINQRIGIFSIWLTCIDVSYRSQHVYKLINSFPNHMRAIEGRRGCIIGTRGNNLAYNDKLIVAEPFATYKSGKRGKNPYYRIGVDYAKRELYDILNSDTAYSSSAVARCYAPEDYPDSYFREIVSESMRLEKNPKTGRMQRIFMQKSDRANEALDLHVMNRVAMEILRFPNWSQKELERLVEHNTQLKKPAEEKLLSDVLKPKVSKMARRREYEKRRDEKRKKLREKLA